jgi:hypothetical protein
VSLGALMRLYCGVSVKFPPKTAREGKLHWKLTSEEEQQQRCTAHTSHPECDLLIYPRAAIYLFNKECCQAAQGRPFLPDQT